VANLGSRGLTPGRDAPVRSAVPESATGHRLGLDTRVDREITERTSFVGQPQYPSDEFEQIDDLVSPTPGMSHQIRGTRSRLTSGQNFLLNLSDTAEFTQTIRTLWKMDDFEDGLYTLGLGLAANVTARTQIEVEALNTYTNTPPDSAVQRNDLTVLLSFVQKC
jgi:hypothetical protein